MANPQNSTVSEAMRRMEAMRSRSREVVEMSNQRFIQNNRANQPPVNTEALKAEPEAVHAEPVKTVQNEAVQAEYSSSQEITYNPNSQNQNRPRYYVQRRTNHPIWPQNQNKRQQNRAMSNRNNQNHRSGTPMNNQAESSGFKNPTNPQPPPIFERVNENLSKSPNEPNPEKPSNPRETLNVRGSPAQTPPNIEQASKPKGLLDGILGGDVSKSLGGILSGLNLDSEKIMLILLIIILAKDGGDMKLLLALGYLLL